MRKSYKLNETKRSILEEILERNRRRLSRQLLKETNINSRQKSTISKSQFTKSTKKSPKVNTVLKSIGFRKTQNSLPILINYIFKNTDAIFNELGEEINKAKTDEEVKRFNLLKDEDNKKHFAKNIKEDSLKHRQIWHAAFSLPNNNPENKEKLLKVAESLSEIFSGYKYVYGLHSNTRNMHLHIVLKCKNDVTNKRLRVGGKELVNINKYLFEKCREEGIDLVATNQKKKGVDKKLHRLPDFMKKTSPQFTEMYYHDNFSYITANKTTLDSLKKLKMNEDNIKKFLWLYNENKKQAIYSINNSPKIFGLNPNKINTYKKENNNKGFTLRKVEIKFNKENRINENQHER